MIKNDSAQKPDLTALKENLPPFIQRNSPGLKELTGYTGRTLANLDPLKQGPPKRIMLGNTVAYERESFLQWLSTRSKVL